MILITSIVIRLMIAALVRLVDLMIVIIVRLSVVFVAAAAAVHMVQVDHVVVHDGPLVVRVARVDHVELDRVVDEVAAEPWRRVRRAVDAAARHCLGRARVAVAQNHRFVNGQVRLFLFGRGVRKVGRGRRRSPLVPNLDARARRLSERLATVVQSLRAATLRVVVVVALVLLLALV